MTFPSTTAACYLMVCFLVAAVAKICRFGEFAASAEAIAPGVADGALLAAALIIGELSVAALFIASAVTRSVALRHVAACGALLLAGIVFLAISNVLLTGRKIACNCFGDSNSEFDAASLMAPILVAFAGLVSLLDAGWPDESAIWIASLAAGSYLLLLHYAWSSRAPRAADLAPR